MELAGCCCSCSITAAAVLAICQVRFIASLALGPPPVGRSGPPPLDPSSTLAGCGLGSSPSVPPRRGQPPAATLSTGVVAGLQHGSRWTPPHCALALFPRALDLGVSILRVRIKKSCTSGRLSVRES